MRSLPAAPNALTTPSRASLRRRLLVALALFGVPPALGCDEVPDRCPESAGPDDAQSSPDAGDAGTEAPEPAPSPVPGPLPDLPGEGDEDDPRPPDLGSGPSPNPELYCAPWVDGPSPQAAVHLPVTADSGEWGGVIVHGLHDGVTAELKLDMRADLRGQLQLVLDGALVLVVEHRPVEYIEAAATENAAVMVWTSPTLDDRGDELAAVLGHEAASAMFGGLFGDAAQTCAMVDTPVMRATERLWAGFAAAGAAACCQTATACRPCTGNAAAAQDAARTVLRDACG